MIPDIEWDDGGYPTDASIDAARNAEWDWGELQGWLRRNLKACSEANCSLYREEHDLAPFVPKRDITGCFSSKLIVVANFSTGGWSGAEELMGLIESRWYLWQYAQTWCKGGHYTFHFDP